MACSSCGKRRAAAAGAVAQRQVAAATKGNPPNLNQSRFERMVYVGESGEVKSSTPGMSYGVRAYGASMYVTEADLKATPERWVTQEEWQKIQAQTIAEEEPVTTAPAVTRSKRKKASEEVVSEDSQTPEESE